MNPQPSSLPAEVSRRKEALTLIYSPSIHWLGGIALLCILGMVVLPIFGWGEGTGQGLATIAGICVGGLIKVIGDTPPPSNPPT